MFFRYGSYTHETGEVAGEALDKRAVFDAVGNLLGYEHTWRLRGRIHAASASALTAAIQALEAAYAVQGQDAGFWLDAGTPSAHYLRSADYIGGVKVTQPPSFPGDPPGQYTTYRDYTIELSATSAPLDLGGGGSTTTYQWRERLSFRGNAGPRLIWKEIADGPAERQTTNQATTCYATQSGESIGPFPYPPIPAPRWPAYCHGDQTEVDYDTDYKLGGLPQYRTTWRFIFQANVPFI